MRPGLLRAAECLSGRRLVLHSRPGVRQQLLPGGRDLSRPGPEPLLRRHRQQGLRQQLLRAGRDLPRRQLLPDRAGVWRNVLCGGRGVQRSVDAHVLDLRSGDNPLYAAGRRTRALLRARSHVLRRAASLLLRRWLAALLRDAVRLS